MPGGQLALARTTVEAGKGATNVTVAGLVGVVAKFDQSKLIQSGAITGTLRDGTLSLAWADKQPTSIPATVSLQYIDRRVKIAEPKLKIHEPWTKDATIDAGTGGRFAVAHDQPRPIEGEVNETRVAYWNATRTTSRRT